MLCCLFNIGYAQAPAPAAASAKWLLTKPAGEGTGEEVTNTGAVTGAMTLRTMKSNGFVTTSNPLINTIRYQRSEGVDGIQFPANQTDIIADTYIQFAVTPAEGQTFNLSSLAYEIGSQGSTSAFRTKVFYSTNSEFANPTQVEGATGNVDAEGNNSDIVTRDAFKEITKELNVAVNSGETFYLRFYPWMHGSDKIETGKYLVLRNVTVAGTTIAADDEDPGDEEPIATKKVLYVTEDKAMAETASSPSNDPIIRMLQADQNIELTVRALTGDEANSATTEIDMAGFDAVVVQESIGSTRAILKPAGALGLAKITKPVLYNKSYALTGGRAFAASTPGGGVEAVVDGVPALAITVPAASQGNALFNGFTFPETGSVTLFKTGSLDNGGTAEAGLKALNFSNATVLSAENTLLANVAGLAATGTPVFINDLPAGTTIGSETSLARIITIGMNFGAISKDNGTNLTAEGLTLWRNAVYSLAGLPVPTALVDPGVVTSIEDKVAGATFSLSQNYPNPFSNSTNTTIQYEIKKSGYVALDVYDALGRKVTTLADGNQAAGTYEVKLNKNLSNGMYFYKLSTNGSSLTRRMLVTQ